MRHCNIYDAQMVSTFLSFFSKAGFNRSRQSFGLFLCNGMLNSQGRPDWRCAILSASFGMYGNPSGEERFLIESRRLYSQELWQQRRKLLAAQDTAAPEPPTADDLTIFVVLAYCELILATIPRGCFYHLNAAWIVIKRMRPERLQSGNLRQLFELVRVPVVGLSGSHQRYMADLTNSNTIDFLRPEQEGPVTLRYEYVAADARHTPRARRDTRDYYKLREAVGSVHIQGNFRSDNGFMPILGCI